MSAPKITRNVISRLFRSRLSLGATGIVLLSSALVGASPTGASAPMLHSHVHHSAHWLVATPHTISPKAIHQTFVVDSSFDPSTNSSGCAVHHSAGTCTLRNAIYAASNDGNHVDAVTIPVGRHVNIFSTLDLTASIVINGSGAFLGSNGYEAFTSSANVTINGLNISGAASALGGAIDCLSGSLLLSSVNINHNSVSTYGGGVYQRRFCNLWIDNSTFTSNSADSGGGALYLLGNAYITRSTFGGGSFAVANRSPEGGAIDNGDGAVVLSNVTVKHNSGYGGASSLGAGIYNDESMDISNSSISYNAETYGGSGAGIDNEYNLSVTNSYVNSNTISGGLGSNYGAGIFNNAYVLNLSNVTMTGNSLSQTGSTIYGGALYTEGGTTNWTGGSISGTQATNHSGTVEGGAVCVSSNSENVAISGVSISGTKVSASGSYAYGGAFYLDSPGTLTNVHISATNVNAGYIYGGAIDSYADWAMTGLTISGTNAHASSVAGAYIYGGAVYLDDYSTLNSVSITNTTAIADLAGTTFSSTETDVYGGALENSSDLFANNLTISGATIIARGGWGVVHGGAIYNTDLATYNNTQIVGFSVTADHDTQGGLIFSNDHFEATNFTAGNSTISVNPHLTSSSNPYGEGTIVSSDGVSTSGKYNFVNATFSNITTSVTAGSYNWGFLLYNNAAFTNSTIANISMAGPSGVGNNVVIGTEAGSNVTFRNSIVASSKPWQNCWGFTPDASVGFNIDNGNSCHFNAMGDQVNSSPKVKPLANNGGTILTAAFTVPGSSALNKANNITCPSVDARAVARPQGGTCDVGAYEYVKPKK